LRGYLAPQTHTKSKLCKSQMKRSGAFDAVIKDFNISNCFFIGSNFSVLLCLFGALVRLVSFKSKRGNFLLFYRKSLN
jgi:hypothetical protein